MTLIRFRALSAGAMLGAVALAGCGSSSTTDATDSTTTTTVAATTTIAATTTTVVAATAVATTVKPAATNPPATNPPATNPPVFASISFGNVAACPATDVPYTGPQPSITISWNAPGADSVTLLIDGGPWNSYGSSGSESLPAACNGTSNVHTYTAVAYKNGQEIGRQSATRGYN